MNFNIDIKALQPDMQRFGKNILRVAFDNAGGLWLSTVVVFLMMIAFMAATATCLLFLCFAAEMGQTASQMGLGGGDLLGAVLEGGVRGLWGDRSEGPQGTALTPWLSLWLFWVACSFFVAIAGSLLAAPIAAAGYVHGVVRAVKGGRSPRPGELFSSRRLVFPAFGVAGAVCLLPFFALIGFGFNPPPQGAVPLAAAAIILGFHMLVRLTAVKEGAAVRALRRPANVVAVMFVVVLVWLASFGSWFSMLVFFVDIPLITAVLASTLEDKNDKQPL